MAQKIEMIKSLKKFIILFYLDLFMYENNFVKIDSSKSPFALCFEYFKMLYKKAI